ncbi:MAG TPA: hypothetical protein V6C99_06295 [Oculatellaceae cyanobacterium]|jgi:hypothetical protein
MAEHPPTEHETHHPTFNVTNAEGRFNWFFREYWPIIVPCALFLLMNAIPLTLSGMMRNPFSSADVVWAGYGLLLILEFVVAIAIVCLAPSFLGVYMLLLAIYSLIAAEQGKAWTVGFLNDGAHHTWMVNSIAILFLAYVLIGNLVFMRGHAAEKKRAL